VTARWLLALAISTVGCVRIPFLRAKHEQHGSPEVVLRFASQADQLGRVPNAPGLPQVTRTLASAVEALPEVPNRRELGLRIHAQANALMHAVTAARPALDAALEALKTTKSAVRESERDQSVEAARQAVERIDQDPATVQAAYREVARAMVIVTGGRTERQDAGQLQALVLRFAVEEAAEARRTGARAIAAVASALPGLPIPVKHVGRVARELQERADRLAGAPLLDYAGKLKEALAAILAALDGAQSPPAAKLLLVEARQAVDALRPDRPFELQRACAQDALRLIADALTVIAVR
jgi:hypothetical protein